MGEMKQERALREVLQALESGATADYIGEPVSQLEHALQTADRARAAGAADHEIVAALLHDIGHLCIGDPGENDEPMRMGDVGILRHEELGADYLARLGFPRDVTELVRGHVQAKRYLVATRPDHAARLSPASRETLRHQGGPMTRAECRAFEADPMRAAKLRLRAWDDAAKLAGHHSRPLASYVPLLQAQLAVEVVEVLP